MTPESAKEMKYVMIFLSFLSMLVLCSFIVDRKPLDLFYLLFVISCMIHYLIISFKR